MKMKFISCKNFDYMFNLLINLGTEQWIQKLRWANSSEWSKIKSSDLMVNKSNEGYVKTCGSFRMYSINRAGHLVRKFLQ